jgi:hypothetical protein
MKINRFFIITSSLVIVYYMFLTLITNEILLSKDWMIIVINCMSVIVNMLAELKNKR